MKKYTSIVLLITAIFFMACTTQSVKTKQYAIVSGRIANATSDEVKISNAAQSFTIPVDDSGRFSKMLPIHKENQFTLKHGRQRSAVYIRPADSIHLDFDAKKKEETMRFSGDTNALTNFYLEKEKLRNKYTDNTKELYSLNKEDFDKVLCLMVEEITAVLNKYPLETKQKALEQKSIDILPIKMALNYPFYHSHFQEIAYETFQVRKEFLQQGETVYEDQELYVYSPDYRALVMQSITVPNYKKSIDNQWTHTESIDALVEKVSQQKIPVFKEALIETIVDRLNPSYENLGSLPSKLLTQTTNLELQEKLQATIHEFQSITKGSPSPTFENLSDPKGDLYSLSDFRGKYLLVDLWATWCSPCRAEIPALTALEKKYHGKNITFLSISIDKVQDKEKWKQFIIDNGLLGVHLLSNNERDFPFYTQYQVKGVPTFILIDPNGNIENPDMPRPSSGKVDAILDKLL